MVRPEPTRQNARHLVVIGSSAGGIDALSTLVSTLPRDFLAPIVIAQHLDPNRPSALHTILARRSTLPVRVIEDHASLEDGVIYVVPANRHLRIADDTIDLRVDGADRPAPSINLLLETAAEVYEDRLIAVILTGTGVDGAAGAHAVKRQGGTVVIQNPDTASHPGMPRSLAPNTVDIVANLEQIGPLLHDLLLGMQVPTRPEEERELAAFLTRLRDEHGIDFSEYKLATIRRRLQRRIVATGTINVARYLAYLDSHPEEYQQLVSNFLIKVTEFFRDPELFDYLGQTVLPELIAHADQRDRELRLWSAGCATGEEAYSLAILVAESLGHNLADWNVRIFATDLDPEAIAFARQGVYSPAAVSRLPDDLVARSFTYEHGAYHVRKHIRALTVFGQHDLAQRAPFPRIDLVVCRNVLIYFIQELQKRALQLFAYSLRDRGLLVLGKSESTSPFSEFFTSQHQQFKIYRRHGERILMPTTRLQYSTILPAQRFSAASKVGSGPNRAGPGPLTFGNRDDTRPLDLPVGVVTVDRRYDIQSINGAARRLLAIYTPAIGDDLIHIAVGVPHRQLREAIDRTFRTGSTTVMEPFLVEDLQSEAGRRLQIICYPQRGEAGAKPLDTVALLLSDVTDATADRDGAETGEADGDSPDATDSVMQAQRQERQLARLITTNRQLLEANRELLSANEGLRTANEEFMLSAEAAQASTEEIETLNEEMQATNEELETLNEELQATVEELNTTNDELHARTVELQVVAQSSEEERARLMVILNTMGDAVLVLHRDGTPQLANTAYERLFGPSMEPFAVDDPEGRPMVPQDTPHARALAGLPFNMEFTQTNSEGQRRWFEASGRPLFGADGRLLSSVLAIRDISDRSLHRMQEQFVTLASHELRTPLTSLQGYLQMLDRQFAEPPLPERARRYVTNALVSVDRLRRLIVDLLDAARLQNGKLSLARQPIALQPLVERAVEQARFLTVQELRLTVAETSLVVNGDTGRLEQALLNLLSNAITHAPGTPGIDIRLRQDGGKAVIDVQDYGPGIAQSDLPSLFARFYQAAQDSAVARHGLGLGLFITNELVTAHGGTITVDTAVGQGSTFTIRLPLHKE